MIPRDAPVAVARFLEGLRAFGAHSIAASLGGYAQTQHASLLTVGVLLAVYNLAEVIGKPVFGSLADRIGPRPILLGACWPLPPPRAGFVQAGDPALVGVARLGQGAAAAAFSPAASALIARLTPSTRHGRAFGGYGAWKDSATPSAPSSAAS